LWLKEKSSKLTLIGISVATIGGILIALADSELGRENNNNPALGNFLALIGAWMASLYLLLGRQAQREGLNINAYIAIAYSTAAIILLPLPLLFGSSYLGYPNLVYLYIFLMAILAQLVGHTSFNWSVGWISPTLVSLVLLFEPLIASFLGWLVFGEIPHALVCAGAVILITGVAVTVFDAKK
jgi:drug/metabolite transporter (DMT)-like permease